MNLAISFDILRNRGIDSHVVCFVWSHLLNCHLYQVCVWTAELDMLWCPYNNHFLFTITAASKLVKRNFPINFFLRYSLGNMYFHNTQTVTSTQSYMSGAFLLKVTWQPGWTRYCEHVLARISSVTVTYVRTNINRFRHEKPFNNSDATLIRKSFIELSRHLSPDQQLDIVLSFRFRSSDYIIRSCSILFLLYYTIRSYSISFLLYYTIRSCIPVLYSLITSNILLVSSIVYHFAVYQYCIRCIPVVYYEQLQLYTISLYTSSVFAVYQGYIIPFVFV